MLNQTHVFQEKQPTEKCSFIHVDKQYSPLISRMPNKKVEILLFMCWVYTQCSTPASRNSFCMRRAGRSTITDSFEVPHSHWRMNTVNEFNAIYYQILNMPWLPCASAGRRVAESSNISVLCGDRLGWTSHIERRTTSSRADWGEREDEWMAIWPSVGEMTARSEADSRSVTLRPNLRLFLSLTSFLSASASLSV